MKICQLRVHKNTNLNSFSSSSVIAEDVPSINSYSPADEPFSKKSDEKCCKRLQRSLYNRSNFGNSPSKAWRKNVFSTKPEVQYQNCDQSYCCKISNYNCL